MIRLRKLSLHEQKAWMATQCPEFDCELKDGVLICIGRICPTPLSREYLVRVVVESKGRPRVYVPGLRRRQPMEPIPHTYSESEPCLYFPGEWRRDMKVATTIITWTSLWLVFYESWLATGAWQGGGIEHAEAA